jgi:hypothetical protein
MQVALAFPLFQSTQIIERAAVTRLIHFFKRYSRLKVMMAKLCKNALAIATRMIDEKRLKVTDL